MDTFQIIFQIATAVIIILAIFQKDKWKMMLFYTINSVVCMAMFFSFGRVASACICIVATLKTLIYMLFSYKKIKPNVWVFIAVEIAYITITIITWQDFYDLLPLTSALATNFGSWQDNNLVLRICYSIGSLCFLIYKVVIGAYIAVGVESVILLCTVTGLVYYCILKKEKPILQVIFGHFGKKNNGKEDNNESAEESASE